jgi:phytanoyl-CoA hydroxylase
VTNHESIPVYAAPAEGGLSAPMLADYRSAGVLVLEDFVPVDACRRLRERALQLVDEFDPVSVRHVFSTTKQTQLDDSYFYESGDKIRFFLEDDAFDESGQLRQSKNDSLNKMGHAMHDLDPIFNAFSRTPELAAVTSTLGYAEPGIIQSMYIFKPPRIGGEVTCHQDSTFIYTEPESCTGFWFALEDATIENGCMQFIPGAHKMPLKQRNYRRDDGKFVIETIDDTPWPEERKLPAEAKAGTMVIFDGRMIDQSCHYPANNWLQRSADLPLRGFS